eukprot:gi/632980091/ref/XP_007906836.1/ PREDICTED: LOW QUALITY PROTEIN: protocadherin-16 [Callorhinchus milii]
MPADMFSRSKTPDNVRTATPLLIAVRHCVRCTVCVNVNPRSPLLWQVLASDADSGGYGEVRYSLSSGPGGLSPTQFSIDERTGEICTTRSLDRDEETSVYHLTVTAVDGGGLRSEASVKVYVDDVNDNRPIFYPLGYAVSLSTQSLPGTAVLTVTAHDKDGGNNGRVTYRIVTGNDPPLFTLNPNTGLLSLAGSLQGRGNSVWCLGISARDGGGLSSLLNAEVNISVVSGVVSPPHFQQTQYFFTVSEEVAIGTIIGTVSARNPPGLADAIHYSISGGDPGGYFAVDGSGRLRTALLLDHEETAGVSLVVQAQSGSPPAYSTTRVTITIADINDNSPVFPVPSEAILLAEGTPVGTVIYTLVATDRDSGANGQLRYEAVSGAEGTFSVERSTGHVRLIGLLDYQHVSHYQITVLARDCGVPPRSATFTLLAHVRDGTGDAPAFDTLTYRVEVREGTAPGTRFLQVRAMGTERTGTAGTGYTLTYHLRTDGDSAAFGIAPDTGWLYVRSALDRERKALYRLTVEASGSQRGRTGTAGVTVTITDENDNPPRLGEERYFFTVRENQPPGTQVGRVLATDRDHGNNGRLAFHLVSGNLPLRIHPHTGELSTKVKFDREQQAAHQVTVVVQDGGTPPRSASGTVYVTVLDENDNAPVFAHNIVGHELVFQVSEGKPSGVVLGTVQAKDPDEGENGTVVYSLSGPWAERFSVEPVSGEVRTVTTLRQSERSEYQLILTAKDRGRPALTSSSTLSVQVLSSSAAPSPPVSTVLFTVVEGTVPGSLVGQVGPRAVVPGGEVTYAVLDGEDAEGLFLVERASGAVFLGRTLDYEEAPSYRLRLEETELGPGTAHTRVIVVDVRVLDRNEHAPRFPAALLTVIVPENSAIGTSLYTFQASDQDGPGPNSDVRFSILRQSPAGDYFRLEPVSGVLTCRAPVDRELTPGFLLVIRATDQALNTSQRLASTVTARVFVTDQNDNSPVFRSLPRVAVLEDQPLRFALHRLVATDPDLGQNSQLRYRLSHGNTGQAFQLEPDTGLLSIVKRLDRESQSDYNLTVLVSDQGSPPRSASQLLRVQVLDVNDETPTFSQSMYTAHVLENQPAGRSILRLLASDRDQGSNAELTYGAVTSDAFIIHPSSGDIHTRRALDREQQEEHIFTVYVQDGGEPPRLATASVLVTVVDENDNAPRFQPDLLSLQLPENQPPLRLHTSPAIDLDTGSNARLHYTITEGDPDRDFTVDLLTGELATQRGLDRELTPSYSLTIMAMDGGSPPRSGTLSVRVRVLDVNDNAPAFGEDTYTVEVPEDAAVGTLVMALTATDPDEGSNGHVRYLLTNESLGMFLVNDGGRVTTAAPLDRETRASYRFLVRAVDCSPSAPRTATARVTVNIGDVNDHAPSFLTDPLLLTVSRHTPANQPLVTMRAEDRDAGPNASIFYRFSRPLSGFSINSFTGEVRLLGSLAALSRAQRTLLVVATDQGSAPRSATGVVIIRLQEEIHHGISFSRSPDITLPENPTAGTTVARVRAQYPDGSTRGILYSIFSGNEDNVFSIRPNTGEILVREGSRLDYERRARLRLVVKAEASLSFSYTNVSLNLQDVNDNSPRFQLQHYTAFIWEAQRYSSPITQVLANDEDQGANGQVTYAIAGSTQSGLFTINPQNGAISTSAIMDREIWAQTVLKLTATDRGSPRMVGTATLTVVILDLNDNSPTIPLPREIRVPEDLQVGTEITRVTGNDVDSGPGLAYELLGDVEVFSVEQYRGGISLRRPLDFERRSAYLLTIRSSDSLHSSQANLTILVQDINDNPPSFVRDLYQVMLPENTVSDTVVVTVTATDRDSGNNGKITYRLMAASADGFSIDPHNGTLFTEGSLVFGSNPVVREVVIEACDGGSPALSAFTTVQIQVTDVNDHAPEFSQAGYTARVREDLLPGTTVLSLEAMDSDRSPENAGLDYAIVGGNTGNAFQLASGVRAGTAGRPVAVAWLVLTEKLDFETVRSYNLTVSATDRGVPPRRAAVSALLTVLDTNDNPPVFERSRYRAALSEAAPVGSEVARPWARDADTAGKGGALRYAITSGDEGGLFAVEPGSGAVRLARPLDRECRARHVLILEASDAQGEGPGAKGPGDAGGHTALVPLTVEVGDVNDNLPFFPLPRLTVTVPENQPPHTLVTRLRALDMDAGLYGQLYYWLDPGLGPGLGAFYLNSSTGELRTLRPLDYERLGAYRLLAWARDPGNASASMTVSVLVAGEDEYQPVFGQETYSFSVPAGARRGQLIGRVQASDEDGGADGQLVYSLAEASPYFRVDQATGELLLRVDSGPRPREDAEAEPQPPEQARSMTLNIQARGPLPGSRSASSLATVDVTQTTFGLEPEARPGAGRLLMLGLALVVLRARRRRELPPGEKRAGQAEDEETLRKVGPKAGLASQQQQPPPPPPERLYHQALPGYPEPPPPVTTYTRGGSIDPSHSSGRGSADAAAEEDDDEIRMINEHPRAASASSASPHGHPGTRGPDSGIQQDADRLSDTSTEAASDWCRHRKGLGLAPGPVPLLGFREAGTARAGDPGFTLDGRPEAAGSLTAIVASDEELRGSYSWDYLLDWSPRFQPLASVFTEIARLKDESGPRARGSKPPPEPRIDPPPLITAVAHPNAMSVPPRPAPAALLLHPGLRPHPLPGLGPRSPLPGRASASAAMSPSFSPSLSPLAARSPAASPFDPSSRPPPLLSAGEPV